MSTTEDDICQRMTLGLFSDGNDEDQADALSALASIISSSETQSQNQDSVFNGNYATPATQALTPAIHSLPSELHQLIFSFLDISTSLCFGLTARHFYLIHWDIHGPVTDLEHWAWSIHPVECTLHTQNNFSTRRKQIKGWSRKNNHSGEETTLPQGPSRCAPHTISSLSQCILEQIFGYLHNDFESSLAFGLAGHPFHLAYFRAYLQPIILS